MANNAFFMHDQVLAYIKIDSMTTVIDGALSFETLAKEFEAYWRAAIGHEVANAHKLSTGLLAPPDPVLLTIWGIKND
jgi:hypothetical protein